MNAEILQKRLERLVTMVQKMRHHQRQYFAYHARSDLDKAKYYERQVDRLLAEEVIIQKTNPGDLFNE
jgi:hypothetical protein